jgi:hypothetical protein
VPHSQYEYFGGKNCLRESNLEPQITLPVALATIPNEPPRLLVRLKKKVSNEKLIQRKVKIKQSHYIAGQSLKIPGGSGFQISRQSAHEGGKVVSHTHRPPLPPGNISGIYFS